MNGPGPAGPCFPCKALPEETSEARLLGIYPQRASGLLMQRVKVPEGRIRPAQLRTLAALARRYTPGYPLHLTTRQDVELHGVVPEELPAMQRGIDEAGLTSVASGGDSIRNVTVCPGSGFRAGTCDVSDVAASIGRIAESFPWARSLPRKFKISVSGCPESCARPWINDLGLVANPDGTFRAVLAGSLGPRPGTGVLLYDALQSGEVLHLVGAALRLFHAEGARRPRGQARLRHLRQRLGDEEFRHRVDGLMRQEQRESLLPGPGCRRVEQDVPLRARLSLPLGDIAPGVARELAEAVEASGAELRLGLQHDLFVFGGGALRLNPPLRALVDRPSVVACPGSTWCPRAIADSRAAARRILSVLPDHCHLSIAVAGCPNNCPHAAAADVGLVGRVKRTADQRRECVRLLVGGGNGQTPALAREREAAVPADKVHLAVSRVIETSRTDGPRGATSCITGRVS